MLLASPSAPSRRRVRGTSLAGSSTRSAVGSTELSRDTEELVRRFLAALSEGDAKAVGELVHPDVRIHTVRRVHRGRVEALRWSSKEFDHLERRYAPLRIEPTRDGALVEAELQYLWRESGEVGDRSRVRIELGVRDGLISFWRLEEDPPERGQGRC